MSSTVRATQAVPRAIDNFSASNLSACFLVARAVTLPCRTSGGRGWNEWSSSRVPMKLARRQAWSTTSRRRRRKGGGPTAKNDADVSFPKLTRLAECKTVAEFDAKVALQLVLGRVVAPIDGKAQREMARLLNACATPTEGVKVSAEQRETTVQTLVGKDILTPTGEVVVVAQDSQRAIAP